MPCPNPIPSITVTPDQFGLATISQSQLGLAGTNCQITASSSTTWSTSHTAQTIKISQTVNGQTGVVNYNAIDCPSGVITDCSVNVFVGATGGGTGGCTGYGPITIPVGSSHSFTSADVHSSGGIPSFNSETQQPGDNFTGVSNLSANQITVTGNNIGTNTYTFVINGEECDVTFNVVGDNGGGGGNGAGCTGYTPPVLTVGGQALVIPVAQVHNSGVPPTTVSSHFPTGIVNDTALAPNIVISPLAAGTTTLTFVFGTEECDITFIVEDESTGNQCTFDSCNEIGVALNGGAEQTSANFPVLQCDTDYTLTFYIPNPNNDTFSIATSVSPAITDDGDTNIGPPSSVVWDSTTGRHTVTYSFKTRATGCSTTSTILLDFSFNANFDNGVHPFAGCGSCTKGNLVLDNCPDCPNGGEPPPQTGCTKSAKVIDCPTDPIEAGAGELIILGPATGCDCPGCEINWQNDPSNPQTLPIIDADKSVARVNLPTSLTTGIYNFIPYCCNCDE